MQNRINETIKHENLKRVWIGDPCYVISDKLWDEVCRQIYLDGQEEVGFRITFTLEQLQEANMDLPTNGEPLEFIQCGTMYGDGCFPSHTGFEYGVDAGCLAVVPDYLIAPEKLKDAERLGKFLDIRNYVNLSTNGEGDFHFYSEGGLIEAIYTGENEDDYEDDYFENDDEDIDEDEEEDND